MTRANKLRLSATLGVFSIVVVAAFAATPSAETPIRIGASLSQTGAYARLGQNALRGYQLCVKQANENGGVLGHKLELIVEDDQSKKPVAVGIYQKLISREKVDAVLSPYSSGLTEAVADVTEKYHMPMVAANAATSSIFQKGRKFVFMTNSPAGVYHEGLIDIAAKRGLKTVAVLYQDRLFTKATAKGTLELAKRKGLRVVFVRAYPRGTTDFTALLRKVAAANPDVLAAATYFDDAVAITRGLKALDINPKLFGVTVGGDLPKFYETLGRDAEFVYGGSQWLAELATLRAGGLIPIARQYPGAAQFVEAHKKEFPGAGFSYQTVAAYSSCNILLEAIKQVGSMDGGRIREAILKRDAPTAYGAYHVDAGGYQTAHKMVTFQWQDGKKVIVWPEELAVDRPRFPTPPWSER